MLLATLGRIHPLCNNPEMAKNPFDSFSKQLLEEILSPYGAVEVSREVPGESQFVDVYFEPSQTAIATTELGLLGRSSFCDC